ncbi:MAG: hypothetical protein AAF990_27360 [Bacteroidota bacterium]
MKYLFLAIGLCLSMQLHATEEPISFVLKNPSFKKVNLAIPGVMNPTLSPFSGSGVVLEVGQKVFFYYRGKEELLLEVTEELKDRKINVNQLIRKRRRALK